MPYIDVEGTPKFPGKMGGGILSFERALILWARVFSGSAFRYLVWAQLWAWAQARSNSTVRPDIMLTVASSDILGAKEAGIW